MNANKLLSQTSSVPLPELIVSLEQATLMAKQLPSTTDPNTLLHIYSSLDHAHHLLSSFISPSMPDNSVSSATGAGVAEADADADEPMQDDNEAGDEENSKATAIDKVEEKMRDCFIKNKRLKRPLSPSSAADDRRLVDDGDAIGIKGYDPHATRLRALDLIYQFHA